MAKMGNRGKGVTMLQGSRLLSIIIFAVVLVSPCLAQNASKAGGYWDRGRWIGYMPPHLQHAQQSDQTKTDASSTTIPEQQDEQSNTKTQGGQSVTHAQYVQANQQRPATYAHPARAPRNQTIVARRSPQHAVARASHQVAGPVMMEGPMEVGTMPMGPDCQVGCDDCAMSVGGDCGCCEPCGRCECGFLAVCRPWWLWGRDEYLGWWMSGMRVPALVTTNPSALPTLDDPNTIVLLGDQDINDGARSGGRFMLGMWFDECGTRGMNVTYLGLGSKLTRYYADTDSYAWLGRPYFDIEDSADAVGVIGSPEGQTTGWVSAWAETRFQGMEVVYRRAAKRSACVDADFTIGWRWLQLTDDLSISQSVDSGATLNLTDHFETRNNFHGAVFGLQWARPLSPCWTLESTGSFSIGNTYSVVRINGTRTGDPDQGLLAMDSNSGTHKATSLASIVELGLSLKRRFHCGIEATFGYSLVYWSDVMRAGDQIDLDVDPRQIPEAAPHPSVPMCSTDFWAQGLHVGLEYTF